MDQSNCIDSKFFQMVRLTRKKLVPGQRLAVQDLTNIGGYQICLVGNSRLKPEHFCLRNVDIRPIDRFDHPGKSAMIDFLSLHGGERITEAEKSGVTEIALRKTAKRQDRIWHADLESIENCGYGVFFTPVHGNALHVRLVFVGHQHIPKPISDVPIIPPYNLRRISNIWRRNG